MVIKEDALTKQKKTSTKNTKIIKRITTKCQTAKKKRAFGRRKTFLFNFIAYFHFFSCSSSAGTSLQKYSHNLYYHFCNLTFNVEADKTKAMELRKKGWLLALYGTISVRKFL